MKDKYDLLETFDNSDVVLFDTSSFNPPDEPFSRSKNLLLKERKEGLMARLSYLDYLHKLAKLDQFYITIGVSMEALNGLNHRQYKSQVQNMTKRVQETSIDPRLIKRHSKKITKLINILEENGRILDNVTNPSEQYRNLYSRHEKVKNEKKVAIVSSDIAMYRSWLTITRREKINQQNFTFNVFNRGAQKLVSGQN